MNKSKKCQIIFVTDADKSNIYAQTKDWKGDIVAPEYKYSENETYINNIHLMNSGSAATNSQAKYRFMQLYIISDEEIKKGDYFISLNWDESYHDVILNDAVEDFKDFADEGWTNNCKKVIATSDIALGLPTLSSYFIETYLQSFNKGEEIKFVNVEYTPDTSEKPLFDGGWQFLHPLKLKTDEKNVISVRPVKDSWNKEELLGVIREYGGFIAQKYNHTQPILAPLDNWAENNL